MSRRLGFAAPGWDLVLDVSWDGQAYRGLLHLAPTRSVKILIHGAESVACAVPIPITHGAGNVLLLGPLPAGPCKLTVTSSDGAVETEWVTLPRAEPAD